jgi:hypothetical protein
MSLDKNKDHLIQTMFEREMTFEAWSAYMMSILVINGCTDERGSWLKRKRK